MRRKRSTLKPLVRCPVSALAVSPGPDLPRLSRPLDRTVAALPFDVALVDTTERPIYQRIAARFDPHDLRGTGLLSYADLIKGRDRTRAQSQVREAMLRGKAFQITYAIRRVDGSERSVLDVGWPTQSQGDEGAAVEGLVIDVTEALRGVGSNAGPGE
jgi:hypothetical protein